MLKKSFPFSNDYSNVSVKVLDAQSCPALCNPMDCSPPGSSVQGILQVRILEWVAIASSRGSSRPRDQTQVSCIAGRFFTVWATREAKNTGVGSLSLSPGRLPDPRIELGSPSLQTDFLPAELPGKPFITLAEICFYFASNLNSWKSFLLNI